ncbi:hypothetical protein Tco_0799355 [Tanacetum coccineum]|uniref:Uncharacterized protein n=1 Tax=Tanacetum coccineum TaxID=301880 RepID=A0ABQ4ZR34_9ASTR
MAALKYKDDHNKIAYLGRERGCEDFTDILGYLDHSPLRKLAAVNEAAGSAAEAPLVPHSTPVSPVREPTPEHQPVSQRPSSPSSTILIQPSNYLEPEDLDNVNFMEEDHHSWWIMRSHLFELASEEAPTPQPMLLGHIPAGSFLRMWRKREEEEVPLRRKRSAYRRARTEFSTPAFEQFQANHSAGPSVPADKGKALCLILDDTF